MHASPSTAFTTSPSTPSRGPLPLTPSKHHVPEADVRHASKRAKATGALVFFDDAHMMSRRIFFAEPPTYGLGKVEVSVWLLDKHVPGARGAVIVGRKEPIEHIAPRLLLGHPEGRGSGPLPPMRGLTHGNRGWFGCQFKPHV